MSEEHPDDLIEFLKEYDKAREDNGKNPITPFVLEFIGFDGKSEEKNKLLGDIVEEEFCIRHGVDVDYMRRKQKEYGIKKDTGEKGKDDDFDGR